jgi:uncharacterized membrane protein (UPF0127 family)
MLQSLPLRHPFEPALNRFLVSLLFGLAASAHSLDASAQPGPAMPGIELTAGIHVIQAELAASDQDRMRGLMFRESMPQNWGMVFLFDYIGVQCMWMRNTLIPLSVAYIGDDGVIVNIEDMAPKTDDSHCSKKPVRFALEMNRGWFAKHGIKPGAKLGGLPKVADGR